MTFYVIEVVETRFVLVEAASEDDAVGKTEQGCIGDLPNNDVDLYFKGNYETSDEAWNDWGIDIDLTVE